MKFRYLGIPLFIAIWVVVFSVPQLRVMLGAQVLGSGYTPYPWTRLFGSDKFSTDDLVQQYPNDLPVLATDADKKDGRARTRAYDNLMQKFPNQPWLIASRVRYTTGWLKDDRLAGAFESPTRLPRGTTTAPERSSEPPTFSPEELQQAIALARRGRQLEPDNCFFDWMLASFLYAGYHDAEALQVLHEGSLKSRYDDHVYDSMEATIAAYQKAHPLLIEGKMALSAMIAFPEYARLRHFARLLSWDAWKSESAGDHTRALRIRSDLARIAGPMMQGRNTLIAGLVAVAYQAIAWAGNPARKVPRSALMKLPPAAATTAQAQYFASYALVHGRADLAQETMQLGQRSAQFRRQSQKLIATGDFYGIPTTVMFNLSSLWLLSIAALVQIALCVLLFLILSLLLLRSHPSPVEGHDLRNSSSFVGALALLFVGGSLFWAIGQFVGPFAEFGLGNTNPRQLELAGDSFVLFALTPFIFGALFCAGVVGLRIWRKREELFPRTEPVYEGISAHYIPRDIKATVLAFVTWASFGMTLLCWLLATVAGATGASHWKLPLPPLPPDMWIPVDSPDAVFSIAALVLTGLCYLGWIIKWRWLIPPLLRPFSHYALRWHRQTLATWLLLASIFYLAFSVAALGKRQEVNAHFDRYLQLGEIGVLQAKP